MPFYKDSQNTVHFLENEEFNYLLPAGCKLITKVEADILTAPTPQQVEVIAKAELERTTLIEAKQAAKEDALIQFLTAKTPAEVVSRINSDIVDLASARQVISKLAVAISVLAKQSLR